MSQFMYLQRSDNGSPLEGVSLHPAQPDPSLVGFFANRKDSIWDVRPHAGHLDDLADRAREVVRAGGNVRETALGRLLLGAMQRKASFCLFYGHHTESLPEPRSEEELFDLIAEQLDSDGSWSWELSAAWRGGV